MKITQMRKDDFYLPILRTLNELGGSGSVEEIDNRVIELSELSDGDLAVRYEKSNALMVPDKISWGRSYLRMAGLIQSETKGLWVLTEEGRKALAEGDASVHSRVAQAVKDYHKAYNASKATERKAVATAVIPAAGEESDTDWTDQLLAKLISVDPYAFERLAQRLLRTAGFTQVDRQVRRRRDRWEGRRSCKPRLLPCALPVQTLPRFRQCRDGARLPRRDAGKSR